MSKLQQGRDIPKFQRAFSTSIHVSQREGNKFIQDERQNMLPSSQTRTVPGHLDEFEYGFPSNGLQSASYKWWGSSNMEEKEKEQSFEVTNEKSTTLTESGEDDDKASEVNGESEPVSSLCSLREQAVKDGFESLKLGVSRGYGPCKLGRRERAVLVQVFKSSLPSQWKYSFF